MSTLQLASDTTGRLVVEWDKHPPHFRVITDSSRVRGYGSEEAAMRAAKRLARKLGLTLKLDYDRTPYRLMAKEFPDFKQDTLPAIPDAWEESSWHNDACPSFVVGDIGLQVFIDFEKAEDREMQGGCRFCVIDQRDNADFNPDLLQTDDWLDVLTLVDLRRERQA